jgi:glycerol kinase
MDSWILWNLTGGIHGGIHATDVTNASRTLLMDLKTLQWDENILITFGIPPSMLPTIKSSSEVYGTVKASTPLDGIPVAGILGDQQAATFGQVAFNATETKGTYGTGNFLVFNTGQKIIHSTHGLLTTVAYKLGTDEPCYASKVPLPSPGHLSNGYATIWESFLLPQK